MIRVRIGFAGLFGFLAAIQLSDNHLLLGGFDLAAIALMVLIP